MLHPPSTKADWVYQRIKDLIVGGKLKPSDRLRLRALAEELGTSQMPVREALRMLQREGLVVIESHRGALVADISMDQVFELVVLRTHLEVLAVEEATPYHSRKSIAELEQLLARMDELAAEGKATEYSELNRRFHTRLYEPAPYPVLREEIQSLWDRMWKMRGQSIFITQPDRMAGAQAEHWAILRAVSAGDVAAAAAAAQRHRQATLASWQKAAGRS